MIYLIQEIKHYNSLFVSACGEVFSVSQDSADFEENLAIFYRINEKSMINVIQKLNTTCSDVHSRTQGSARKMYDHFI